MRHRTVPIVLKERSRRCELRCGAGRREFCELRCGAGRRGICALTIMKRHSKKMFPFLLSEDNDKNIHIFDFTISPETCVEISQSAGEILWTLQVSSWENYLARV